MYNDSVPLTLNNESFYAATGWQERFTAGVQLKLGRLLIDFQPEYIKAENLSQASISDQWREPNYFTRLYFQQLNVIDWPWRSGTAPIEKFFLGQSAARMVFDHLSVGLSNENIWWGPGRRNSLIMTNNAPGFLHADLKTVRPVKLFLVLSKCRLCLVSWILRGLSLLKIFASNNTGRELMCPKKIFVARC